MVEVSAVGALNNDGLITVTAANRTDECRGLKPTSVAGAVHAGVISSIRSVAQDEIRDQLEELGGVTRGNFRGNSEIIF